MNSVFSGVFAALPPDWFSLYEYFQVPPLEWGWNRHALLPYSPFSFISPWFSLPSTFAFAIGTS
jgi:hypothetical protein